MKRHLLIVLCVLALAFPAMAGAQKNTADDDVTAVETLLKEKTDAILTILQEKDLDISVKKSRIMELVQPIMDFALMAKLTLGKDNWGRFSPAQQTEFVDLFVERLKRSYLDKTAFYDDEKIVYKSGVLSGNKVHVPMTIVSGGKPIELLYKFYNTGSRGWMAYDIEINGVSLIKSYQAQFSEILKTGTVKDLMAELRKPQAE
jgi:phospholipid transport system substrate-binding protein